MAQREQANVPLLMTIGAVSGFLIIVLAIGVQAWFLREVQQEVAVKWDDQPVQPLTDQLIAQQVKINEFRWVDQDKKRVAIPIEEAMKLVAQGKRPAPTTKPATQAAKTQAESAKE
ncbi:MAG: hypothetical protein ABIP55_09655 [Tepidisphaeraceae bacterium]